jgi:uncharacterized protein YacL
MVWVWVILGAVFLALLARSRYENMNATSSRVAAWFGVLTDGLAMVALGFGVFGLLMALVLGVFASTGPRLVGSALRDTLLWSSGLILLAAALQGAGVLARRWGGRGAVAAGRPGH